MKRLYGLVILWHCLSLCVPLDVKQFNTFEVDLEAFKKKYKAAVQDAVVSLPSEVAPLTAIVPWNKKICFNKDKSKVLVVSWIPAWAIEKFYRPAYESESSSMTTSEQEDVYMWVTVVPEVQNIVSDYCLRQDISHIPIYYRIQQLLGLPPQPHTEMQRFFVQLWVSPLDLFRPCIDTEVVDTSCVPDVDADGIYKDLFQFAKTDIPHYRHWFDSMKSKVYNTQGSAFPWTRLGYTYDWGHLRTRGLPVGVSEFVVKQGATIHIEGIYDTFEYIQRAVDKKIETSFIRSRL